MQHCTDLPLQLIFPAHNEQGKTGPGLGSTLSLIKRRRKMRRRASKWQEKREKRQAISKKLRAVQLWSFWGQLGEKIICLRGVPGVTRILGKANSHFDPTQTGSGNKRKLSFLVRFHFSSSKAWFFGIIYQEILFKMKSSNILKSSLFQANKLVIPPRKAWR